MTEFVKYVDVVVALPLHDTYTYGVPPSFAAAVAIGKRILVPFGSRTVTAYVTVVHDNSSRGAVKPVLDVLDPDVIFPPQMLPFFQWISDYYIHPPGQVIKTALPAGINTRDTRVFDLTTAGVAASHRALTTPVESRILKRLRAGAQTYPQLRRHIGPGLSHALLTQMAGSGWIAVGRQPVKGPTQTRTVRHVRLKPEALDGVRMTAQRRAIVDRLRSGDCSLPDLKQLVPTAAQVVRGLTRVGAATTYDKPVYRDPFGEPVQADQPHRLNEDQQKVVQAVSAQLQHGFCADLLVGVTGSGKTEVYLQLAAKVLESGRQTLVLVPEIGLISQMERRFRARFGEKVAVLHSGLSGGERFDQWQRILSGRVPIAVGTRSAIFAPFKALGLIVVDEEHDGSFKQDSGLPYNARDLAVVRARMAGAIALLGSATPSIQSLYNAQAGKFKRLSLPERIEAKPLPDVQIIDLRQLRIQRGARRFISPQLHRAMDQTLARGEQVLLFLNRRGYAGYPVCTDCGTPLRCKRCDITLTLHRSVNAYKCHYCGYFRSALATCNDCGSSQIKALGLGTEKLAAAVAQLFPDVTMARMDRDTVLRKGALVRMLKKLRRNETQVLVGTQMVAKGHDFPNITLVGVVCADLSLNIPDFRAAEQTFQLMAQVAGRAGRGDQPGRVILQTYNPDHFSILAAKGQDPDHFFYQELGFRQALGYPPYTRLVQLRFSGSQKDNVTSHATTIAAKSGAILEADGAFGKDIQVLGPAEAPLGRLSNRYRWQLLIKASRPRTLNRFVRRLVAETAADRRRTSIRLTIDVDPYFLL